MSKYRFFSGPYYPVFSPNAEKHGLEKTPYLDTFHAVKVYVNVKPHRFSTGIFDNAVCWGSRTIITVKLAFIAGSSKHGKAARACVASKCVVAKYLRERQIYINV